MSSDFEKAFDYNYIQIPEEKFREMYEIKDDKLYFNCYENVYCDGSSINNGRPGATSGIGIFFEGHKNANINFGLLGTKQSSNRAEYMAAYVALNTIWSNLVYNEKKNNYTLYTDFKSIYHILNGNYRTYYGFDQNTLPNVDIIIPMIKTFISISRYYDINKRHFINNGEFKVEWVRAHSHVYGNERAHALAQKSARRY